MIFEYPYHCMFYYYGKARTYFSYCLPQITSVDSDKIMNNIYLGNLSAAVSQEYIKENDINHIISAVTGAYPIHENVTYTCLDLLDESFFEINKVFNETNNVIEEKLRNNKNILIHCICGVSRSTTILCAYFIKKYNITPNEALKMIKDKRPIVNPNPGFMKQLDKYYEFLNDKKTN
jgi:protein-tyrosine phosphatase